MKLFSYFLLCVCLLEVTGSYSQSVIPVPTEVTPIPKEEFVFDNKTTIIADDQKLMPEAALLQRVTEQYTGYSPKIQNKSAAHGKGKHLYLQIDTTIANPEGYEMQIRQGSIRISGKTEAGVFYGIQTLAQLLNGDGGLSAHTRLDGMEIKDSPRYAYRALMVDPARHFIPLEDVKRFIDLMARYKLNALQLHLTDDQGWRIEIKKYPLLTSIGAFRDKNSGNQGPHNGFYTQSELKELISYAADRHIEIIPELDIPGHTVAAIQAYKELGCKHMDSIPISFGKTTDRTLCAAKEEVYDFYTNVLGEVAALFPSKRIHLGGDEAIIDKNWGHCPDCRALMEAHGFHHVSEVMGYFFTRIHDIVRQNGKELMLWCELDNIRMPANDFLFPYPDDCTLFTWRMGLTPKVIELTHKAGIKLVASPGEHCYFDYPQWKGDFPEFNNWGMPLLSLEQAYNWDPGYGLPADAQKHITGVAGLFWGEAIQDINRLTYMAFPRALALAEAGWSQMENRNWDKFKANLLPQLPVLMREGVSFRVPFEIYRP